MAFEWKIMDFRKAHFFRKVDIAWKIIPIREVVVYGE